MDPDKAFGQVMAALRRDPRVREAKMFGARGLKVGEKYFAMLYKGQLVVKLPAERVAALVSSGDGTYFEPGHGRVMKEWIAFGPELGARWPRLAEESKTFVESVSRGGRARSSMAGSGTARTSTKKNAKKTARRSRWSGV